MSVTPETGGHTPFLDSVSETTSGLLANLGRESVPLSETETESMLVPAESESEVIPHPEPNLWDEICKEFAAKRPPFSEGPDAEVAEQSPTPATPPPRKSCSPRDFLEYYVFPVLLPILEDMLRQAKLERCFERKRTKFNALDFLTEHLYRKNPNHTDREGMELGDIPFVKEHWKDHPRPPLPMSLLWTEDEAILIIQNFWRGYLVRREPSVQELRVWQRDWRLENEDINETVSDFWAKQMPDGDPMEPRSGSEQQLETLEQPPPATPPQSLTSPAEDAQPVEVVPRESQTPPQEVQPPSTTPPPQNSSPATPVSVHFPSAEQTAGDQ